MLTEKTIEVANANPGYYAGNEIRRYFMDYSQGIESPSIISLLFAVVGIIFIFMAIIFICSSLQKKFKNFKILNKTISFFKIIATITAFISILVFLLNIATKAGLTTLGVQYIIGLVVKLGLKFFIIGIVIFGIILMVSNCYPTKR